MVLIGIIQGIPKGNQRRGESVPHGIFHNDLILVSGIPEAVPAGNHVFGNFVFVIQKSQGPVKIGNRVGVILVIGFGESQNICIQIFVVIHGFVIQRKNLSFLDQFLHHILGGTDDIIGNGTGLVLCVHFFRAFVFFILDSNAGFFLELFESILIDILSVVENRQRFSLAGRGVVVSAGGKAGNAKREDKSCR